MQEMCKEEDMPITHQMCEEEIVIVGAGIAGLATALGLHRLGIPSVVLESSDELRVSGFALAMWTNGWRALDALGVGDFLREKFIQLQRFDIFSHNSKQPSTEQSPEAGINLAMNESRCVKRRDLLETLEKELPQGTVRYSSRIVSIEESGNFKLLRLADGSVVRTKVLIGCDGVNSLVAKWLGLGSLVNSGRAAIRGLVDYPDGHGFGPNFHGYFGGGVRYGILPCDEKSMYWFFTFIPSLFKYDVNEQDPLKMKQFVLTTIRNVPKHALDIVERTKLGSISSAQLKLRLPCNILLGNIAKNGVCVTGDALHPMTPDVGQGGCSSLEDSIVLSRCLAKALLSKPKGINSDEEHARIRRAMENYARERRWRSFNLISTSYMVGMIQESNGKGMNFLRKMFLSQYTAATLLRKSEFDCGKLTV